MATMNKTPGDVFKYLEAETGYSVDAAVLTPITAAMQAGTVLGKVTASGKYAIHDPAAIDGTEFAAAVLYRFAGISTADQSVVVVRRHAIAVASELAWIAGATAPQKAAALAALELRGVVAR